MLIFGNYMSLNLVVNIIRTNVAKLGVATEHQDENQNKIEQTKEPKERFEE